MKNQKIIVLSADALVEEDMHYLRTLKNFKKYLSGGVEIKKVRTIYPTITYPAHVTLSTGVYPNKHGINGNYIFCPGKRIPDWKWFADAIKVPDIFTLAKEAGYRTAAVFWPVTGNHPHIDYLIDEYWTQNENDTPREAFARSGSKPEVIEKIVEPCLDTLIERKHPECDRFIIECACRMIKEFKPDLLMIHPGNIDGYRHISGVFSPMVTRGVEELDEFIGMLAESAIEAGVWKETNLVLTSDHGQQEVRRIINMNVFLADNGLIEYDEAGNLTDWKAYCESGAMSANVYLKDPGDKELYDRVYSLLCHMRDEGIYGIGEVFTTEEADKLYNYSGDFSFVIETDNYTSYGVDWVRPLVIDYDQGDYRRGRASHGYLPHKGPQPVFAAKGPAFKENVVLEEGRIIDQAPTFAKVLGFDIPNADGKSMNELLNLL